MHRPILFFVIALIGVGLNARTSLAEEINYNLVTLTAQAEQKIENDVMVVILEASEQASNAQQASQSVNEQMNWALAQLRNSTELKQQTQNYRTQPVYNKQDIVAWRVSQQLRLESQQIDNLAQLAGELQQQLKVISMAFEVSPDKKKSVNDSLIQQALSDFQSRAKLITQSLSAKSYRLVNLQINESGSAIPYQVRNVMRAESSYSVAEAPAVQAGESKQMVTITGSIQLVF